jgi:taurine dioxygenase
MKTPASPLICHRPFEPFGAEVDLDLSAPLDADTAAALRDLFFRHSLLVFRGQSLSMDDQKRAVSNVGPVLEPCAGDK